MIGDRAAGMTTLETRPFHRTAEPPAAASVEPIPPARPAATTGSVTSAVLTRPFAMVAATASERNAPTRLSRPERATATLGGRAPVAIEVAMALPVSWKPLVKSKARAVMTTSTRTTSFLTKIASLPGKLLSRLQKEESNNGHLRFRESSPGQHLTGGCTSACRPFCDR